MVDTIANAYRNPLLLLMTGGFYDVLHYVCKNMNAWMMKIYDEIWITQHGQLIKYFKVTLTYID